MDDLGGIAFAVEAFARATEEQRKKEALDAMRDANVRTTRSRSIDSRRSSLRDIFEMVQQTKAATRKMSVTQVSGRQKRASRPAIAPGDMDEEFEMLGETNIERPRSNSLSPSDPGSPRAGGALHPLADEDVCRLPPVDESEDAEEDEASPSFSNGHSNGNGHNHGERETVGRTALGGSVSQRQSWVKQGRPSVAEAGWFDQRVASPAPREQDAATIRRGWRQRGLQMLARGDVAALVLAGGQGTRLGSSDPKGMYDIGLPSGRSLFQLQAERILRLQQLCRDQTLGKSNKWTKPIPWYVMTGPSTDLPTRKYFSEMGFFGLRRDQVFFFCQGCLPAFSMQGQVLMEGIGRVCVAPDGNGGMFRALKTSGALDDMERRGVRGVDCYCVDNALAQFLDPEFLGFCDVNKAEVAARGVPKRNEEERVGVFAKSGGRLRVVEYSELSPTLAAMRDPSSGHLVFNWSNICMQYFSKDFMVANHDFFEKKGRYHIAQKQIKTIDGEVEGVKLEAFIFDPFVQAERAFVFEVDRDAHFAPVKNCPGKGSDTPESARRQVMLLHADWVRRAGGVVEGEGGLEVSQNTSINGEGLEELCAGKTFAAGTLVSRPAKSEAKAHRNPKPQRLLAAAAAALCAVLAGSIVSRKRARGAPTPPVLNRKTVSWAQHRGMKA